MGNFDEEQKVATESWVDYSKLDKTLYTGMISGLSLLSSFATHPLTVLTVRQQTCKDRKGLMSVPSHAAITEREGILLSLKSLVDSVGIKGMFRGWVPVATMGIPCSVIYMSVMESSREILQKQLRETFPILSHTAVDVVQSITSSVLANFLSLFLFVPGEVLSTRLIVQDREGLGTIRMISTIHSENGYRGFFRGFSGSFYVGVVASSQWWWTYSMCRRELHEIEYFVKNPIYMDALSGLVGGLSSTAISHPIDTIKTRMMSSTSASVNSKSCSFSQTFTQIVRTEGLLALFRGFNANLCQASMTATFAAISYEFVKRSSVNDINI